MSTKSGGMMLNRLDSFLDWLYITLERAIRRMFSTPALGVRWCAALFVFVALLLPDMLVLMQWTNEFLSLEPGVLDLQRLAGDYAFEAIVIMLVCLFAVGVLFTLTINAPDLQIAVMIVSGALVCFGAVLLGVVSTRCLTDLRCDGRLFFAAQVIIGGVTLFGFLLPRFLHRSARPFVMVFLAVAVWQSWLWLWQAYQRAGITATHDALRGLLLVLISWFWLLLFAGAANHKPKPKKKNHWQQRFENF